MRTERAEAENEATTITTTLQVLASITVGVHVASMFQRISGAFAMLLSLSVVHPQQFLFVSIANRFVRSASVGLAEQACKESRPLRAGFYSDATRPTAA